jgi:hypothetical protein
MQEHHGWTHVLFDPSDGYTVLGVARDVETIHEFAHGTIWLFAHPDQPPTFTSLGSYEVRALRACSREIVTEVCWEIDQQSPALA